MTGKIPLHQIQMDTRKREYPQVKLSFNTTLCILNYIYNTVHFTIGRKRKRCGECFGCKAEDCRECKFCVDKPNGGPGKLKQVCKRRKCVQVSQNLDKKQQQNGSLLSLFITNVSLNLFFSGQRGSVSPQYSADLYSRPAAILLSTGRAMGAITFPFPFLWVVA